MKPPGSHVRAENDAETSRLEQSAMIKKEARRLGFDDCGIARAEELVEDAVHLRDWLDHHYHADMRYMARHAEKRTDPTRLVEGARSVISVVLNYYPAKTQSDPEAPVLSKYAYGKDYHGVVREKLERLLHYISANIPGARGRAFVDTAPILEKAWAVRAGLGWIGKNTCLISPKTGSFCFIGTLIVDISLHYDRPMSDFCGTCTRCIDACPTKAIIAPRVLDAGRCVSYLTIENKGGISEEFKGLFADRVFGCDICQDVCPWNRKVAACREKNFEPDSALLAMTRHDWFTMDETRYREMFRNSAVKRATFNGLKRNLDFIKK